MFDVCLAFLVVCLAGQPAICETVIPDYVYQDTGQPLTVFEFLGAGGQDIARKWRIAIPKPKAVGRAERA
jgi:hypothetical protein